MNITTTQLQAIRALISKEDREQIGFHTNKSVRTIEAILQGDRFNDDVEQLTVITAKQNIARLSNIIADIEAKNLTPIKVEEYSKYKESSAWANDISYGRCLDVYLQLSHSNIKEPSELWTLIWQGYKDIIPKSYYCVDLFVRLLGVSAENSVKFYNKKIQEM
jgi:hypothetical protein